MANSRRGKIFHIYDEVYKVNWYIIYACSRVEYNRILKKGFNLVDEKCSEKVGQAGGFYAYKNAGVYSYEPFIWVKKFNFYTIIHEVLHGVFYVLLNKGIKFGSDNNEAFCYYAEFMVREVTKKMRGIKK